MKIHVTETITEINKIEDLDPNIFIIRNPSNFAPFVLQTMTFIDADTGEEITRDYSSERHNVEDVKQYMSCDFTGVRLTWNHDLEILFPGHNWDTIQCQTMAEAKAFIKERMDQLLTKPDYREVIEFGHPNKKVQLDWFAVNFRGSLYASAVFNLDVHD